MINCNLFRFQLNPDHVLSFESLIFDIGGNGMSVQQGVNMLGIIVEPDCLAVRVVSLD